MTKNKNRDYNISIIEYKNKRIIENLPLRISNPHNGKRNIFLLASLRESLGFAMRGGVSLFVARGGADGNA